jgi:hypothetical protein
MYRGQAGTPRKTPQNPREKVEGQKPKYEAEERRAFSS